MELKVKKKHFAQKDREYNPAKKVKPLICLLQKVIIYGFVVNETMKEVIIVRSANVCCAKLIKKKIKRK